MLYSDIEPVSYGDLWPGRILTADVSSWISVGGGGKGLSTADVMARVSRGWPMPPLSPEDPAVDWDDVATAGYVIHVPLEDKPDRTVWHRLHAAGADMSRIEFMGHVERTQASGNARRRFSLPADLGLLRSKIAELGDVRLAVIDPFMSAATTTVAFNQQLRFNLLEPLQELADDTGVAVLLVSHFTKGTNNGRLSRNSGASLVDYVAGSKGFTDTLRLNTVITDDPDDSRIKVVQYLKGNGGAPDRNDRYIIVAKGPQDPDAHIEWEQPPPVTGDEAGQARLQRVILDELIRATGPVTAQQMVALTRLSYSMIMKLMKAMKKDGQIEEHRGAYTPVAALPPGRDLREADLATRLASTQPDLRAAASMLGKRGADARWGRG